MFFTKKRLIYSILAFTVIMYLYHKREILFTIFSVLLYAAAITLLLSPMCSKLTKRGIGNTTASVVSILSLIIAIIFILSVFIPYLTSRTAQFIKRSMPVMISTAEHISDLLNTLGIEHRYYSGIADQFAKALSGLTTSLARRGISMAAHAGRIGFSVVLAYYFLRERNVLVRYLLLCVPIHMRRVLMHTINSCKNAVLGYLSGMLKTSLFVSAATFFVLCVLRIPDAFLLSVFMGLFEILPYAGPLLALIPIIISALPLGINTTLLTLILVFVIQQVEGNIVSPYFTAASTSIHPLTAISSVFLFGSLFGIWGILLAIPVIVIARSVFWSFKQFSIV